MPWSASRPAGGFQGNRPRSEICFAAQNHEGNASRSTGGACADFLPERRPRPLLRFRLEFLRRSGRHHRRDGGHLEQPPHERGLGPGAHFVIQPLEIGSDRMNRHAKSFSGFRGTPAL